MTIYDQLLFHRVVFVNLRKIFSPGWLTRQKILSQYQRRGIKHASDIEDVTRPMRYCVRNKPELNFNDQTNNSNLHCQASWRKSPGYEAASIESSNAVKYLGICKIPAVSKGKAPTEWFYQVHH
ncbi:hypothetical protein N7519_008630 [Penicillium mononematosum]|uniref:uncharacterized protein n=1 Tax=Penicillium mononematosum TaxID=268346 RepID=UPI0025482434|nr:uncharacterized protein N7519_008630 [Penicillium mononematosum]KAJ6178169.1 hypothetical protein N7519_008630 [Penicillium mononematosum]